MKRSTLLEIAHRAWRSGEKDAGAAEVLAASGLFSNREIQKITRVNLTKYKVYVVGGHLAVDTLDLLAALARVKERGEIAPNLVEMIVESGTTRAAIKRLTGYDAQNPRTQRPDPDGTSSRDA